MDLTTEKTCDKVCKGLTYEEVSWIFRLMGTSLDPGRILHELYLHKIFENKRELFQWIVTQIFNSWRREYK